MDRLKKLEDKLEKINSDKVFREIIQEALDILVTESEISEMFSVSKSTIRSWSDGRSTPHVFLRPTIAKKFRNLIGGELLTRYDCRPCDRGGSVLVLIEQDGLKEFKLMTCGVCSGRGFVDTNIWEEGSK